jgi:IS30 family transposase
MNYKQLATEERYQIYSLNKEGLSQKQIAAHLNRSPSTICRELNRNQGLRGYRPKQAQSLSDDRRRHAAKSIKVTATVYQDIETLIRQELSPQQIVDYFARHKKLSLHHVTIYQLIYANKIAGGDWYKHLRIMSKPYRKRYGHYDRRGKLKNRVSIDDRPLVVDQRCRIGDWEGDTIIGKNRQSALLTLVERKTLYTIIVKISGKKTDVLADNMIESVSPIMDRFKTLTLDNGLEFSDHERIAKSLGLRIYFAHPYSSWERGINENTNGLISQYFPKGMDLNEVTQEQIEFVMDRLNNRPRASRGNKSPNELFMRLRVDLLAA